MFSKLFSLCLLLVLGFSAGAQLGKIPATVTDAFNRQYPDAKQVSYEDNFSDYSVHFVLDSIKMTARFNSKGIWKGSERASRYEDLSEDVKQGFTKSKYADWKIREVSILVLPEAAGGGEQAKIKVSSGDLNKRVLYFNRTGRLVRDNGYL
jgi:hypothetical protein